MILDRQFLGVFIVYCVSIFDYMWFTNCLAKCNAINNIPRPLMTRLSSISFHFALGRRKRQFQRCRTLSSTPGLLSSDPWPLPHTPEHLSSTVTPSSANSIPPLPRHNETLDKLRARLVYQSRKRGTLECDLLLSTFAKEHLDGMGLDELKEYDHVCYIGFS